jgi:hypothetical protein
VTQSIRSAFTPVIYEFATHSLIGTIRRELLHHVRFWDARDLERKLADFQIYYNAARSHASLAGRTPLTFAGGHQLPRPSEQCALGLPARSDPDKYRVLRQNGKADRRIYTIGAFVHVLLVVAVARPSHPRWALRISRRSRPASAGSSRWEFTVDLPENNGTGWWTRA